MAGGRWQMADPSPSAVCCLPSFRGNRGWDGVRPTRSASRRGEMTYRTWWVVLVVFAVGACQTADDGVSIDEGAGGTTITLAVGDVLNVALPATPSTGFTSGATAVDGALPSAGGD